MITAENEPVVDWRLLQAEIEKLASSKVFYTRYNKEEKGGHFVVNKFEITEENRNKVIFLIFSGLIGRVRLLKTGFLSMTPNSSSMSPRTRN